MKETEQTLFLKSNILHIRTNEGEFEVSNPEEFEAAFIPLGVTIEQYFKSFEGADHPEWPGEVKFIKRYKGHEGWSAEPTARDTIGTVFARLLPPKEEKKDDIQPKRWEESTSIPSKSAYKEFEKLTPLHDMQVAMGQIVESSDPQENIFDLPKDVVFDLQRIALADDEMSAGFGAGVEYRLIARSILNKHRKPVAAPSESQEEMWNEVNEHINAQIGDYISLEAVKLSFILTRKPE